MASNRQQGSPNIGQGRVFVLSGPSGCGKTTLVRSLLKDIALKKKLVRSISFTTRPRRPGEKEGVDYFFINSAQFRNRLKAKKILEWTRFLNYYYGTPREYAEGEFAHNRSIALCLDIKGAMRLKKIYGSRAVTIFILPPSIQILKERIHKRGCRTNDKVLDSRMKLAEKELRRAREYDYRVTNDNFSLALAKLKGIIGERLRLQRQ
jgi:guanylate kinase